MYMNMVYNNDNNNVSVGNFQREY